MTEQQQTAKVYGAIEGVMADIAKAGVGKNATNTQQNFKYRSVDDVMDALSPLLAKHHLLILPSVMEHKLTERMTANQKPVLHALLKLTYTFVCPIDGSTLVVGPIYGESMDSGDKATNKAMATGYKYLCTQTFCIPFTGDDPDAQTHEIAGTGAQSGRRGSRGSDASPPAEKATGEGSREGTAQQRTSPPSAPVPGNHGERPDVPRPGGMFGYGKKYRETPWNVMAARNLEFFLNADGTPMEVRHKIVAEMAWRDYEVAQMERVDEEEREKREAPLDEDIP
jgi:hypothetical protein